MKYDYDVIIIGSGPAGFSCAMQSTKFDKKVLIVEASEENLGGSWINKGTVPSKALRAAAKLIQSFHSQFGDERGRKPFERFRMEDIMDYKRPILESKNKKVKDDIVKNEVDTANGWGKIIDANTVEVFKQGEDTKTYTGKNILVSTGSRPSAPQNVNIDKTKVLDYASILDITHIPRRLVIVGSGIIAFEYATIFAALGTRVTVLSDLSEILPFLDHEIKNAMFKSIQKKNIQIFNNISIENISSNDLRTCEEVLFKTKENNRLQVVETDHVLYIGGKIPNTDNLGLEELGIERDKAGYMKVDGKYRTNVPNIYAAGDVIGYPALASASFLQGRLASCEMFGSKAIAEMSDTSMPYGIYSIPEISGIGLTEEQAEELNIDVTVGRAYYSNLTRADLNHETDGILKLVFRTDNLKLLGVHIFGEQATDMIHLGQSIMAHNDNIKYFIERVLNYPTYTEAYKIAAFNGLNRVHKAGVKYKKILNKS
ncbi:Si-specific NAD(P)(+) transhydrogenase [Rhodohalobacter sulfatireducens]|uniref:Soluble pyridine nucleotide transhydrogenase n=1 Tax=Rhodohalobacter sulfatireducens TaxID=2911366 RepID=A0ABS9KEU4_9BACT|nr:Si-specific NAD(P)(+) transhydrogenase [Rhodohalobacter sulfatireducens]MCG2589364.1 Si-specific NAD(P)(+) transhydrogenase [Rhodohalobacter sulfatireducens]